MSFYLFLMTVYLIFHGADFWAIPCLYYFHDLIIFIFSMSHDASSFIPVWSLLCIIDSDKDCLLKQIHFIQFWNFLKMSHKCTRNHFFHCLSSSESNACIVQLLLFLELWLPLLVKLLACLPLWVTDDRMVRRVLNPMAMSSRWAAKKKLLKCPKIDMVVYQMRYRKDWRRKR